MIARLKRFLKESLRRRGYELYRRPWLPRGTDPWEALHELFPTWQPAVIFDVGANVGTTATAMARHFPSATIHAFEPVSSTHASLVQLARDQPRIQPHRFALGAKSEQVTIHLHTESTLNSLRLSSAGAGADGPREEITVTTLDEFCAGSAIHHVDLMKADTEGYELSVFAGARRMLRDGAIDAVLVEAGLIENEPRFTPLSELRRVLEAQGFLLVGIFEQRGWRHRRALDFCDALFVREKILPP